MNEKSSSRREFLKGTLSAIAGIGMFGMPRSAEATQHTLADQPSTLGTAVVEEITGDALMVRSETASEVISVRTLDFPPGWAFRPGDVVVLSHEPDGYISARPFVISTPFGDVDIGPDSVSFDGTKAVVNNEYLRGEILSRLDQVSARASGLLTQNHMDRELRAFGFVEGF
jgi:hypothetical protein